MEYDESAFDAVRSCRADIDSDVALVTPIRLPLNNQEYLLEEDRFSSHPDLKEGWNAFSGSGDVTAEVVYANFGRKEDFEQLRALGVSVKGLSQRRWVRDGWSIRRFGRTLAEGSVHRRDFVFGPTLARIDGVAALRLANADLLPYDVARYSSDLETHIVTLEQRAKALEVAADLSGLRRTVNNLGKAARDYVKARDRRLSRQGVACEAVSEINAQLIGLEKAFLNAEGLQGRPWSRSLYASPDPFSGYASWMLPGLRYEIETRGSEIASWEKI